MEALKANRLREPTYRIFWNGRDITRDISPHVLSIHYVSVVGGESDSLEIVLEDKDNLWKSDWYPTKGDTIRAWIGYKDEEMLYCGEFEIDTIEFMGAPDVVRINSIGVNITKSLRQRNTYAWEETTLSKICEDIAKKHALKTVFYIDLDIPFKRVDQHNEADIFFVKQLAEKYGYRVKVIDNCLIVMKEEKLEEQEPDFKITREIIMRFTFKDQLVEIYRGVEVKYYDPASGEERVWVEIDRNIEKGDLYKINERCENVEQARERAKGALKRLNKWKIEGELDLTGTPQIVAGRTVFLEGFFKLDGKYLIEEARHVIDRNRGYTTMAHIRRV